MLATALGFYGLLSQTTIVEVGGDWKRTQMKRKMLPSTQLTRYRQKPAECILFATKFFFNFLINRLCGRNRLLAETKLVQLDFKPTYTMSLENVKLVKRTGRINIDLVRVATSSSFRERGAIFMNFHWMTSSCLFNRGTTFPPNDHR